MRKKPRKRAKANVQTFVVRSEFFEDKKAVIGKHSTPEEIISLFEWLKRDHQANPDHTEEANRRLIERYRQEAKVETVNIEWAKKVEDRAKDLLAQMNEPGAISRQDFHSAVYDGLLLQEAYYRMRLTRHEANASTGRKHRSISREGQRESTKAREKNLERRNEQIRADAPRRKDRVRYLADKWELSESQIGRILRKKNPRI